MKNTKLCNKKRKLKQAEIALQRYEKERQDIICIQSLADESHLNSHQQAYLNNLSIILDTSSLITAIHNNECHHN